MLPPSSLCVVLLIHLLPLGGSAIFGWRRLTCLILWVVPFSSLFFEWSGFHFNLKVDPEKNTHNQRQSPKWTRREDSRKGLDPFRWYCFVSSSLLGGAAFFGDGTTTQKQEEKQQTERRWSTQKERAKSSHRKRGCVQLAAVTREKEKLSVGHVRVP